MCIYYNVCIDVYVFIVIFIVIPVLIGSLSSQIDTFFRSIVDNPSEVLHRLRISELARPEDLTTEEACALTNMLASQGALTPRTHRLVSDAPFAKKDNHD